MNKSLLLIVAMACLISCPAIGQDDASSSDSQESQPAEATLKTTARPFVLDPRATQGFELTLVPQLKYRILPTKQNRLLSDLGVSFRQITDEALRKHFQLQDEQGLVVESVRANSIADDAGLRPFAIVKQIGDRNIQSVDDVFQVYDESGDGDVLAWHVIQDGGERRLEMTKPSSQLRAGEYRIGVNVRPADEVLRSQLGIRENTGLVITGIIAGSPAEKAGLKVNDVLAVAGRALLPTADHLHGVTSTSKDNPVTYKYYRGGKEYSVEMAASNQVGNEIKTRYVPDGFLYSPRFIDFTYGREFSGALRSNAVVNDSTTTLESLMQKLAALEQQLEEIKQQLEKRQ